MSFAEPWTGFDQYLARWQLTPDGDPRKTRSSRLLPVLHGHQPAMLKVAIEDEEKAGGALMAWWNGRGAAPVLAHGGDAVLLERAGGSRSLSHMARNGEDEQASQVICDVVAGLHASRSMPPPALVPLFPWFKELEIAAASTGGILSAAWATACHLLADPREVGVLHGDIHHDNILDFGPKG